MNSNPQLFIVTSILMLMLGRCASGMLVNRGACPSNLTAVGDFDIERYMGKWYIQLMYPYSNLKKLAKCKSIEVSRAPDGKIFVMKREINSKTDTFKESKLDVLKVDAQSGTILLAGESKVMQRGVEVYVLDTDYDQFAIHYMCLESDAIINFQWVVILTRERIPKPNVLPTAIELAKSSGIDTNKLNPVEQQACPVDAS